MKLQIKSEHAVMEFEMTHANALSLIGMAIKYARGESPDTEPAALPQEVTAAEVKEEQPAKTEEQLAAPPAEKPAPHSRLESLFGDRSKWNMPAADSKKKVNSRIREGQEEYKGFMYIECEACGKVKGFCTKNYIRYHRCECGHENELNCRPAHVKCKCGETFTYNTNIQRDEFTIDCLTCGAPVDMTLGAKGTAFVTVGYSPSLGWME